LNDERKINKILKRDEKRQEYYRRLIKFVAVCLRKNLRMIFENPWSEQTYLKSNFLKYPDIVDMDRSKRGDFFKKPTAFWFWNCEPTRNKFSYNKNKNTKTILNTRGGDVAGLCSEERSMISSEYAKNWILDFVLGEGKSEFLLFDL
jgi:hypothetical protein